MTVLEIAGTTFGAIIAGLVLLLVKLVLGVRADVSELRGNLVASLAGFSSRFEEHGENHRVLNERLGVLERTAMRRRESERP